jgi:UDP-2,3-diacylglucosamine hydrolase
MRLEAGKKVYFASDFHLGVPDHKTSLDREKKIIRWLSAIQSDAAEIFIVGDIFDFWFEYRNAIPKGFVRLQGKIAELTDSGIPVHFFTGNHDMWMFDYLPKELGVSLHRDNIERTFNDKVFFIGHGDGLGPGDHGYKLIKKVFASGWAKWLFARFHPNFGIGLANFLSRKSRAATGDEDSKFLGPENEWLFIYSCAQETIKHRDFYIFGHRHLPMDLKVGEGSRYINLGEWINQHTFAVFDGSELMLEKFTE